jgi:hypothetical protein
LSSRNFEKARWGEGMGKDGKKKVKVKLMGYARERFACGANAGE